MRNDKTAAIVLSDYENRIINTVACAMFASVGCAQCAYALCCTDERRASCKVAARSVATKFYKKHIRPLREEIDSQDCAEAFMWKKFISLLFTADAAILENTDVESMRVEIARLQELLNPTR